MRDPRARLLRLLGWALIFVLLAGCTGGRPPKGGTLHKVRFTEVIHSIFYLPQYVAQAKGFFADEGIDLDTTTAQGSDRGTAALLAGTADIALVGPETTVFVHNQDSPNKVKLFAQLTTRDGSFLVSRRPASEFDWAATKGDSIIGWRPGSMPQLVATAVLKQKGLTAGSDVDYITNLSAPAMAGAFQSGQGGYLQVFEPLASQMEQLGVGHVVASFGELYGDLPYTGYIATDKYIAGNPDIIQNYTNAVYRAMRYVQETDPAIIAGEVSQYFEGTDVALLEASIRRYKAAGAWNLSPVMKPADYERLQSLMIEGGVLEASMRAPFEAIATNRFAEDAVKNAKR